MFASAKERATSLGIQAWLAILEDEKLSVEGQAALSCLKRDLESLAVPEESYEHICYRGATP